MFLQFIVALIFYILYRKYTPANSVLEITLLHIKWNLGWFYGIFILFLLVGTSNAVNLTDGLDGLAGGLSAISFLAFGLISWGSYWAWDPKETWALITLLVYAGPLHGSSVKAFRNPKFFHAYTIIAFLCVLITYFGVNLILGGMHSYS